MGWKGRAKARSSDTYRRGGLRSRGESRRSIMIGYVSLYKKRGNVIQIIIIEW